MKVPLMKVYSIYLYLPSFDILKFILVGLMMMNVFSLKAHLDYLMVSLLLILKFIYIIHSVFHTINFLFLLFKSYYLFCSLIRKKNILKHGRKATQYTHALVDIVDMQILSPLAYNAAHIS